MIFFILLLITLTTAKEETFADVYRRTMKDNNGRVTYDGESSVLVLFYYSKDQNMSQPSFGHPFIVPNDEMTKLKINNFYELIQKMETNLENQNGTKQEGNPIPKREPTANTTQPNGTTPNPNGNTTQPNGTTPNPGVNGTTANGTTTQNGTTPTAPPTPGKELYCRILVNYRYSDPIKVLEIFDEKDSTGKTHKAARFPKYLSVRTELGDDSRVKSVQWDHDSCETCKKEECLDNFCTFTDSHYGDKTCSEAKKGNKSACGLIIYFAWKGPAHAGFTSQYLKSYRHLPSHYTKYSKGNQFDKAASDLETDWFSF